MKLKNTKLKDIIPVFPLSNFIVFPKSIVPLNIFEPRYIQMIEDSMSTNRIIGMVQPRKTGVIKKPDVYDIGCACKITSFNETEDGRYIILIEGLSRFVIRNEIDSDKMYRLFKVDFNKFEYDTNNLDEKNKSINFNYILKELKQLFKNKGYNIDWKNLNNQSSYEIINSLSMASTFSIEEKQTLLEASDIFSRKDIFENILKTYTVTSFSNRTIQ